MTTWFVNQEAGNDANAGTSFAAAFRSLTGVVAAAPGDLIKIMASKAKTTLGSVTWNNLSKTLTIPANLTANIDLGGTAWNPSANVTATTSATRKEGTLASQLAIAAAFTTGKVAYMTFASTSFAAFKQVSFWMRTNLAFAAGVFELRLCSDTVGNVTVNTIAIPAIPSVNVFTPITVDTGGALGATIQSVAIYALVDPGTITIITDNILACKDSTAVDAITLTSLVSKDTAGETWYNIQSINGTTVLIDNAPNTLANAGQGYAGATETVTTSMRQPSVVDLSATSPLQILSSGSVGNNITISGGWDRVNMSTQTDETWLSGSNAGSDAWTIANRQFIDVSKVNVCRFSNSLMTSGANPGLITFTNCAMNSCGAGVNLIAAAYSFSFTNWFVVNAAATASLSGSNHVFATVNLNNNIGRSATLSLQNSIMRDLTAKNPGSDQFILQSASQLTIYNLITASSGTGVCFLNRGGDCVLINATISEATVATSDQPFSNYKLYSHKEGGTVDNHKIYVDGGQIQSETGANRRTLSGMAWALLPTSTNRHSAYPLQVDGIKIAVVSGTLVSVQVWVKRTNTGLTSRLFVAGGQLGGPSVDTSASAVGVANTYEQLTVTWTPTEAGVVDVLFQAYGGTTFTAFFDDMVISQA